MTFQPDFVGPSTLAFPLLCHGLPQIAFCPSPAHLMTNFTAYSPCHLKHIHICSKILPISINLGSLLFLTTPQGYHTSQKHKENVPYSLDRIYFRVFSFLIMSSITNLLIPYPSTVGLLGPFCSTLTQYIAHTYPRGLHIPCLCPDPIVPRVCFVLLQLGYPKLATHDSMENLFPPGYSAALFGIFPPFLWSYSSFS